MNARSLHLFLRRLVPLCAVVVALVAALPAGASFPGENGRIVFSSNRVVPSEIYSMNDDGTNIRRLTWNATQDQFPRVSPDGSRIAFARTVTGNDLDIWVIERGRNASVAAHLRSCA